MMATMMKKRMMMTTMKMLATMLALKTTSRMEAAQTKRVRRAEVHQPASRLLQRAQASFLRLLHGRLINSICILRQNPTLALGHTAPSKVQIH